MHLGTIDKTVDPKIPDRTSRTPTQDQSVAPDQEVGVSYEIIRRVIAALLLLLVSHATGNRRMSNLATCLTAAPTSCSPSPRPHAIVDQQKEAVEARWNGVRDEADLSEVERTLLRRRHVLNPFVLQE